MTKKEKFVNFIKQVLSENNLENLYEIDPDVATYWEAFSSSKEENKPMFTDNGKLILQFLKDHQDVPMWKAKDVAEALLVSSRMVSGAMRKLVSDGYVEKVGQDPVIYSITEQGKNIEII